MPIYPVRIQFKTACQILDVSRETLNQLIKLDPTFPQKIKMGTAKQSPVYFDYAELAEWHNSQKQGLAAMEA
ncbi:helix-turn-helix transcriptional regulator [Acinetobacter bohemicus]|nr:AlpA family phage regulatory protein [Acinetobacter bohemicus]